MVQLKDFRKLNIENEDTNVSYVRTSTMLHVFITLLVETVICVILGYGGYLVYRGRFDAGQLVEYIAYFTSVVWPVMAVAMLIEKSARGKASMNRITELLEAKIDVRDRAEARDVDAIRGKIEFRDLTFRYPDGEFDALDHVSFTIEAGESVGIVGKTRDEYVEHGGGPHVAHVGVLVFDVQLPKVLELDQTAVENAAKLADVHGNVSEFKDRYETILGERGVTVSGGQKQRISIARALMKNAPILILDDSVSAVDTDTEKVILENLRNTRQGKTTILIAHRISTIESLDKIVFVEDGRVIAVGSHESLLSTCPAYARMVELQRLEDEAKE